MTPLRRPPLVLLHGWGGDARVWGELPHRLAPWGPVECRDLPGYGATPDDGAPHDEAGFSACAARIAATLPPGSTVCGWSLGALLALAAARAAPDRVGRLVLIGATPRFTAPPTDSAPPGLPPETLAAFVAALAADPAATRARFVALMHQGDARARALIRALASALAEPHPAPTALARGLAWLGTVDLRAAVAAIRQPTLLLHGAHDPLMPLAAAEWLAATLPAARLECVAGAAHAPFLSDPERAAAAIGAFLDATAPDREAAP